MRRLFLFIVIVAFAMNECTAQLLPKDQQYHFIAGAVVSSVVKDEKKAILLGVAAGTTKELYDQARYGRFDPVDLGVTILGSVVEVKTRKVRKKIIKKLLKRKKHEKTIYTIDPRINNDKLWRIHGGT